LFTLIKGTFLLIVGFWQNSITAITFECTKALPQAGRGRLIERQKIDNQKIERRKIECHKVERQKIERQNAPISQFPLNLGLSYLANRYNIAKPYKATPTFLKMPYIFRDISL
jgi:hypothetical protein